MPRYIDANKLTRDLFDLPYEYRGMVINIVNSQPTVDIRKRGCEWITVFIDRLESCDIEFECSSCKNRSRSKTKYCPNCGAEMDKGESDGETKI